MCQQVLEDRAPKTQYSQRKYEITQIKPRLLNRECLETSDHGIKPHINIK